MATEHHARSLAKALSWRVLASLTTFLLVYAFTGTLLLSVGVGAIDLVVKLVLYYFHERLWTRVRWGLAGTRTGVPLSSLAPKARGTPDEALCD